MADQSAKSELKFTLSPDAKDAKGALLDFRDVFREIRNEASKGINLSNLKLIKSQVEAGIRPLNDFKAALADTIEKSRAANKVEYSPINDQKIADAVSQLNKLEAAEAQAAVGANTLSGRLGKIGDNLQQAFLPLAGISASITGLLGASAKQFGEFERTLNTIQAVGDVTASQLEQIKQSSLDLGQSTIFNNQQVAQSYLTLSRAGFTVQQSLETVPGLLNLAAAAGGDLDVATKAVIGGMKGFGLETEKTAFFVDVLSKAANESDAEVSDLAESFKQIAPVARQAQQPFQQIAALLGILATNQIKGADAGSDLRNIITRLIDPAKDAQKVLKQLNVQIADQAGNIRPLTKIFADLGKALSQYDSKSRNTAAAILAGQENLKTFLTLANTAPETINAFVASLDKAEGSTSKTANTINKGLVASFEQFKGSIETLGTTLGDQAAPALETFANALTKINTLLSKDKGLAAFAVGALGTVAAITALGAAISGLFAGIGALNVALAAVGVGLGGFTLAIGAAAVAAGLFTAAMAQYRDSIEDAQRSTDEVLGEIDQTTAGLEKEGQAAIQVAQQFDKLNAQTKKTKEQKAQLKAVTDQLIKQFPDLRGKIDNVTAGYTSLEREIRGVIAAQLAMAENKSIDQELEKIKKEREAIANTNNIISAGAYARGVAPSTTGYTNTQKIEKQLQDREEALNKRRETVGLRIGAKFEKIDAAIKKASDAITAPGTKKLDTSTSSNNNAIINARLQLQKKINDIDEQQVRNTLGEYEAQREKIENVYQEQIDDLHKVARAAKQDNTPQVQEALIKLYQNKLKAIQAVNREEQKEQTSLQFQLNDLKNSITSLFAAGTIQNPFDDITADAQRATGDIQRTLSSTLQQLSDLAIKNPSLSGFVTYAKQLAKQQFIISKANIDQTAKYQELEQDRALSDEVQANKVAKAEIANNTLEIEKANNVRILEDLKNRISIQEKIVQNATSALGNSNDPDLKRGLDKAQALLDTYRNQKDKQETTSARNQAKILADIQRSQVDLIQNEINLLGERPELVDKLVKATAAYIQQLEKELELTTLTAEERNNIQKEIETASNNTVGLQASTDGFSRFLDGLSNFKFSNSSLGSSFKSLLGNVKDIRIQYKQFQDAVNKGQVKGGGGFFNFISKGSAALKNQFAGAASDAVQAFEDAFGSNKFTSIFKNVANIAQAALSSPILGALTAVAAPLLGVQAAVKQSGGFLQKYAAFIDPLGFRKLFSNSKSAAEKAAENLAKAQKFTQNVLSSANKDDLASLTKALHEIQVFKSGGGAAFEAKKSAADQLKQAIEDRKVLIDNTIKDLDIQNQALIKALQKSADTPLQNLKIDRDIALSQLITDRDKQLDQFKDSLAAQQAIEKNFLLNQQALYKQSAEDLVDAIIEEQNTIRELQADTQVNNAKASGNQIAIINAQLQAQLVAIDNDIAAFKGAEETKTAFLAAKAAERTAIIKASNDQINDLLKQGLDILNEGLVVGETKAQSQARRLGDLFGTSLNPLGLIQSPDGSLLNTTVNVGAGAVQFILDAASDVNSLIAQLSDPIIQAKLLAALNLATART